MPQSSSAKLPLTELLKKIEQSKQDICSSILDDYRDVIYEIPGAGTKHQVWRGGYISHVEEAMNISIGLYDMLSSRRQLSFSLSDALFCVFLHDFDKVLRSTKQPDGTFRASRPYGDGFADEIADIIHERYGYTLSNDEHNAIKYAHGEGKDYHPTDRVMSPLATIVHCSDVISARIWFDEGRISDSW